MPFLQSFYRIKQKFFQNWTNFSSHTVKSSRWSGSLQIHSIHIRTTSSHLIVVVVLSMGSMSFPILFDFRWFHFWLSTDFREVGLLKWLIWSHNYYTQNSKRNKDSRKKWFQAQKLNQDQKWNQAFFSLIYFPNTIRLSSKTRIHTLINILNMNKNKTNLCSITVIRGFVRSIIGRKKDGLSIIWILKKNSIRNT